MINQFENNFSTPRYWMEPDSGKKYLMAKESRRIQKFFKDKETKIPTLETTETKCIGDDPLKILKLRLAKGEITKEEFKELKDMLES